MIKSSYQINLSKQNGWKNPLSPTLVSSPYESWNNPPPTPHFPSIEGLVYKDHKHTSTHRVDSIMFWRLRYSPLMTRVFKNDNNFFVLEKIVCIIYIAYIHRRIWKCYEKKMLIVRQDVYFLFFQLPSSVVKEMFLFPAALVLFLSLSSHLSLSPCLSIYLSLSSLLSLFLS